MGHLRFKRIHLVVLESVGIGGSPDPGRVGGLGAHTLRHIAEKMNGLKMPNMERFGLSNIEKIKGIDRIETPQAYYTKMAEASNGKDTMTGHWELMGLITKQPFKVLQIGRASCREEL